MNILVILFTMVSLTFSVSAHESGGPDSDACQNYLIKNHGLSFSQSPALSDESVEEFRKLAIRVREIAKERGLQTPPHMAYLTSGPEMTLLAASGGPVVPSALDGLRLLQGVQGSGGVMEFTVSGCPTCRAWYNLWLDPMENLGILFHVAGHHHVFATDLRILKANTDPVVAAADLSDVFTNARKNADQDRVAAYYHFLNSFGLDAMDLQSGYIQLPEELDPTLTKAVPQNSDPQNLRRVDSSDSSRFQLYRDVYTNPNENREPTWRQTLSVLPALPHFVPATAESWMKDLVRAFERKVRWQPALSTTIAKNEGLASFMMYMLARDTEFNTSADRVAMADLIGRVILGTNVLNLKDNLPDHLKKDPNKALELGFFHRYFLGEQGWYRLFQRFVKAYPEIKSLPALEQLKRFMEVEEPKTHGMTDFEFFKYALDDEWWKKNPIYLYRPLNEKDLQNPIVRENYERASDKENLMVVVTRDPARLLRFRHRVMNHNGNPPPIAEIHPKFSNGEILYKNLDDEKTATHPKADVLTLFARSQIYNRPIRLTTWISSLLIKGPFADLPLEAIPIAYVVKPNGDLEVISEHLSPEEIASLQKDLKKEIAEFRDDVYLSFRSSLGESENAKWADLIPKIIDHNTGKGTSLSSLNPSISTAISEYRRVLRNRLARQMDLIAQGKISGTLTPTGLQIEGYPPVPHFRKDQEYQIAFSKKLPPAPIDAPSPRETRYDADDEYNIGIAYGDYQPGDLLKGPSQQEGSPQKGGKSGQGDDEDFKKLEIPLEIYGKMIASKLGLPNLHRTEDGEIERDQKVRKGVALRTNNPVVMRALAREAFKRGNARRIAEEKEHLGTPNPETPPLDLQRQILIEGLMSMRPENYPRVGSREEERPFTKVAQIFVMDWTGSMSQERIARARNYALSKEAVLRALYEGGVEFRYVVFQQVAKEVTREQFYSLFAGGSTSYKAAFERTLATAAKFPPEEYSLYVDMIGDGELLASDSPTLVNDLEKLMGATRFFSFMFTNESMDGMSKQMLQLLNQVKNKGGIYRWMAIEQLKELSDIEKGLRASMPGEKFLP